MKITVIGESNIDISVRRLGDETEGGCSPANVLFHHGGVARNVAHNLRLLGHQVFLVSVFGGDSFAQQLMDNCSGIGIDISLSTRFKDKKSPFFLCLYDKKGDMLSALSDIDINNHMDLDWLRTRIAVIKDTDIVVADTLLTSEAIAFLIDHIESPLFLDSVSPKRAGRITQALGMSKKSSVTVLKCNLGEAQAMTGLTDPIEASKALNALGVKEVFLTLGSKGVVYADGSLIEHYPSLPSEVVNATGSGDAFLAGVIHASALGHIGARAVPFGLRAAQHNLGSESPVNPTICRLFDKGPNPPSP